MYKFLLPGFEPVMSSERNCFLRILKSYKFCSSEIFCFKDDSNKRSFKEVYFLFDDYLEFGRRFSGKLPDYYGSGSYSSKVELLL